MAKVVEGDWSLKLAIKKGDFIMSNSKRIESSTGVYHVMMRGNRKSSIFEETEDYEKFIDILKDHKDKSNYEIYAYCLMDNHIHILVKVSMKGDSIGTVIKRICSRYAKYYNKKYDCIGHLFSCNFKSEPVEDEKYLFTVVKYIHRNPVKAGICDHVEDYPHSSWKSYFTDRDGFVNTKIIKDAITDMKEFMDHDPSNTCMDIREGIRISDMEARKLLLSICGCKNIEEFKSLEQGIVENTLRELLSKGAYMSQLQRLTGIPRKRIAKYREMR